MDWESQDDGYVAALLVEDGAKDLDVGSPVLVFVEDQARPSTASPRLTLGGKAVSVSMSQGDSAALSFHSIALMQDSDGALSGRTLAGARSSALQSVALL